MQIKVIVYLIIIIDYSLTIHLFMDLALSKIFLRNCVHCLTEPHGGYEWKEASHYFYE